jgi:hypothetical protein
LDKQGAAIGEILQHDWPLIERCQEHFIAGTDGLDKTVQGVARPPNFVQHTAAGVDEKSQTHRFFLAGGEVRDLLWQVFFVHQKILRLEPGDMLAL